MSPQTLQSRTIPPVSEGGSEGQLDKLQKLKSGGELLRYEEILTGESSCESTWSLSCDGVGVGMLWSSCNRGAAVDLWELEHQFGGWGGASSCPLFEWPNLC